MNVFIASAVLGLFLIQACATSARSPGGLVYPAPAQIGGVAFAQCHALPHALHIIGGFYANDELSPFNSRGFSFRLEDEAWRSWSTIDGPHPKRNFASALVSGKVFVFGGEESGRTGTRDLSAYDLTTNSWQTQPESSGLAPRHSAALAAIPGHLIVFGGKTDTRRSNWGVYAVETKRWTVYDSYDENLSSFAWVVIGERLFIAGGFEGQKRTNAAMIVDPAGGAIDRLPAPNFLSPRANMKSVRAGDKILLIGGTDAAGPQTDGASYDISAKAWAPLPPLPDNSENKGRKGFEITLLANNEILLWGGRNSENQTVPTAYALDTRDWSWHEMHWFDPPPPRFAHCLGLIDKRPFIFGGLSVSPQTGAASLSDDLWIANP